MARPVASLFRYARGSRQARKPLCLPQTPIQKTTEGAVMKRLILILLLPLFAGLQTTRAQFIVSDPANLVENATTAAQQLKQYMKMVQQLKQARKNVRHMLNQSCHQLNNLRSLTIKESSSNDRNGRNLNDVDRQDDNKANMRKYVLIRDEDLNDVHERLHKLTEDAQ